MEVGDDDEEREEDGWMDKNSRERKRSDGDWLGEEPNEEWSKMEISFDFWVPVMPSPSDSRG